MNFREVVSLVYEGFELGILDDCHFGTNDDMRVVSFYYGGLGSGSHSEDIWFVDENTFKYKFHGERAQELLERVEAARQCNNKGIALAEVKAADQRCILHEIYTIVSRIGTVLNGEGPSEV